MRTDVTQSIILKRQIKSQQRSAGKIINICSKPEYASIALCEIVLTSGIGLLAMAAMYFARTTILNMKKAAEK